MSDSKIWIFVSWFWYLKISHPVSSWYSNFLVREWETNQIHKNVRIFMQSGKLIAPTLSFYHISTLNFCKFLPDVSQNWDKWKAVAQPSTIASDIIGSPQVLGLALVAKIIIPNTDLVVISIWLQVLVLRRWPANWLNAQLGLHGKSGLIVRFLVNWVHNNANEFA